MIGALDRVRADEMLDALEEAFEQPYAGFAFRRKGEVEDIRDEKLCHTASRAAN